MRKLCVFGAGAIGSHVAARLALGGADVSVVARGGQLAAIAERGIVLHTEQGSHHVKVRAAEHPAALGPQDAVIVTVKAPATLSVAKAISPLLHDETPVVFVLNGIPWWYSHSVSVKCSSTGDPDAEIAEFITPDRVIGGVVNSPARVEAPGVVAVQGKFQALTIGEIDGALSQRAEHIAALLDAGGLKTEVTADIRTSIWNKLIINLMTGPMCVLSRANYRELLSEPACRSSALALAHEVVSIARAWNCSPNDNMQSRLEAVQRLTHRPSILQDLEAGRLMEIDALLQAPRAFARAANISTPTLDLLASLVVLLGCHAGLYPR